MNVYSLHRQQIPPNTSLNIFFEGHGNHHLKKNQKSQVTSLQTFTCISLKISINTYQHVFNVTNNSIKIATLF